MNNLGKRIRNARKSAGFTQESFAEAIGVSRTAVARWEHGDIEPNLKHIIGITQLLNVSSDYLLGIVSNKSNTFDTLSDEAICALEKFILEIR